MAVSLSGVTQASAKKSLVEGLAGQAEKLQEIPLWKTIGSYALPILSSFAMGPLGGLLTQLGGGASALGSLFGGGKLATTIAQGLGKGLEFAGAGLGKAQKGAGFLKNLGHTGVKALYNIGTSTASRSLLDSIEGKSADDLFIEGGPLEKAYGKDALKKMKDKYNKAQKLERDMTMLGSIGGAFGQQGMDIYGDKAKDWLTDLFPKEWSPKFRAAKKWGEETSQSIRDKKLMGQPLTFLDKLKSGGISSTETKRLSSLTSEQLKQENLQNMFRKPMLDFVPEGVSMESISDRISKIRNQVDMSNWGKGSMADKSKQMRYSPVTSGDNILQGLIGGGEGRMTFPTQGSQSQAIEDLTQAQSWKHGTQPTEFLEILSNIFRGKDYDESTVAKLLSEYYGRGQ